VRRLGLWLAAVGAFLAALAALRRFGVWMVWAHGSDSRANSSTLLSREPENRGPDTPQPDR
jgi:hypothetical protein